MNRSLYIRLRELARIGETFVRLDALEEISYPLSLTFSYLGILLPVIIQFFVAQLVDRPRDVGGDYFTFAVIGMAVAGAMQQTLNKLGNRLQQVQNRGVLESLLTEPAPWWFIPIAMNIWHYLSAAIVVVLVLLLGVLLGASYQLAGIVVFTVVVLLGMLAGSAIGIASGAILLLTKRSSPLITVYGLAATLLGGAVFPISLLPGWLEPLSFLVPHAYAIGAAREALMVTPPNSVFGTGQAVAGLALFAGIGLPLSLLLFARTLRVARDRGVLGTY